MFQNRIKIIFMSVFCILILAGLILFISMLKSLNSGVQAEVVADNVTVVDNNVEGDTTLPIPSDMVIPTPEPSSELGEEGGLIEVGTAPDAVVIMSGTSNESKKEEPETKAQHYVPVKADISWTDAQKAAAEQGGHLVTISNTDELQAVKQVLLDNNIDICWIGCHRDENGVYQWENGEQIDIGQLKAWGYGEPSYTDQGQREDYIMLWWMNGNWSLNDAGNDPCSAYPKDYSGKMGYIIEYDNR